MAFDFKKEYKEFYLPKNKPEIVTVPPLEGFWWQDGVDGVDYTDKSAFKENLQTIIRLRQSIHAA